MWTVEQDTTPDGDGFTLIGCVDGRLLLYVLFEAPGWTPPPPAEGAATQGPPVFGRAVVELTTSSGVRLDQRGISMGADRHSSTVVASFDRPPPGTTHLDVHLHFRDDVAPASIARLRSTAS